MATHPLVVFMDGCPDDCLSLNYETSGRWHTIAMPVGGDENQRRLVEALKQINPNFTLRKWGGKLGGGRRQTRTRYRRAFCRNILPALDASKSVALAWSFQESTVPIILPRILQDFRLRYEYIPVEMYGRIYVRFRCGMNLGKILKRRVDLILTMADSIWTYYRDIKSRRTDISGLVIATDFLSGDDQHNHPLETMFRWILRRVEPNTTTMHRTDALTEGQLLADNLAGMLDDFLNFPDDPDFSECRDDPRWQDRLIWHETKPDFSASRLWPPKLSPIEVTRPG